METETKTELQLHDHVDFLDSNPVLKTYKTVPLNHPDNGNLTNVVGQKKAKKKKANKKPGDVSKKLLSSRFSNHFINKRFCSFFLQALSSSQKRHRSEHALDGNELLFFPKNYDASPLNPQPLFGADLERERRYLETVKKMPIKNKRKYRAERDLRYLHKNAGNAKNDSANPDEIDDESLLFCVHHLTGKCNQATCKRIHQMRMPRLFGVCRFYLTDSCQKGDLCEFMHSEFPCRYFYLDLNHPKVTNDAECRFKHGGPLNKELSRYFKKHIELWVKDMTKSKPEEYEKKLNDFHTKFETKQFKLEQDSQTNRINSIVIPKNSNVFSLENILTRKQFEMLAECRITSASEINKAPVDVLMSCGLTLDQIYEITMNTSETTDEEASCDTIKILEEKVKSEDVKFLDIERTPASPEISESSERSKGEPPDSPIENVLEDKEDVPDVEKMVPNASESQNEDSSHSCDSSKVLAEDLELSDDDSSEENSLIINEDIK